MCIFRANLLSKPLGYPHAWYSGEHQINLPKQEERNCLASLKKTSLPALEWLALLLWFPIVSLVAIPLLPTVAGGYIDLLGMYNNVHWVLFLTAQVLKIAKFSISRALC